MLKKKNISKFVTSLFYIVLGAGLALNPTVVEDLFGYILAGAAILIGVIKLVSYAVTNVEERISADTNGFAVGASLIVLGVFVLTKATMFLLLIPFVLGFMITYKGLEGIQNVLNLRKFGYSYNKISLIISLVIVAFGIMVMVNPFTTANVLFMMLGIGLFISGLTDLVADFFFTRKLKKGEKVVPVEEPAQEEPAPEAPVMEEVPAEETEEAPTLEV